MSKIPCRGEVWFVQLDPTIGHEQAKTRPCLVISDNIFNKSAAQLHVILPLTSKKRALDHPFRIQLEWAENEVSDPESFILCDQIRTVSRLRFKGKSIGTASQETMEKVEFIMSVLLRL